MLNEMIDVVLRMLAVFVIGLNSNAVTKIKDLKLTKAFELLLRQIIPTA